MPRTVTMTVRLSGVLSDFVAENVGDEYAALLDQLLKDYKH